MRACVDIGGTKVSVTLNDGSMALQAHRSEPTAKSGSPEVVARQVIRMVDAACAEMGLDPQSVTTAGVCAPGPFVRQADGTLALATPNLCGGLAVAPPAAQGRAAPNDWRSVPLEGLLRQRFSRLRIENDGIAALEAERRWGALQGVEDCAYVTWSTGVGSGLCVGGRVLRGKHGNAGHFGHSFATDDEDARCGCGNLGDLEALVGGLSIERRFGLSAGALMTRAEAGDAQALVRVDELCRILGRGLYNLVAMLDLSRISLGGSVFLHHPMLLLPRLQAQIGGRLPSLTTGCALVTAGLGERVGDFAALALLD
jgi:glucokinase